MYQYGKSRGPFKCYQEFKRNSHLQNIVADIDVDFLTEETKAYLLGILLRKNPSIKDSVKVRKCLDRLDNIENKNSLWGKRISEATYSFVSVKVVMIFAALLIILGLVRILNGVVVIGINSLFLQTTVVEGGLPLIMGLGACYVSYKLFKYKKRVTGIESRINGQNFY